MNGPERSGEEEEVSIAGRGYASVSMVVRSSSGRFKGHSREIKASRTIAQLNSRERMQSILRSRGL